MSIKIEIGGGNNNYLTSVVALSKKVYKEQDVSSLEKYRELYRRCPEGFIFALDKLTGRLVGCLISLPLESSYFKRTCLADFDEGDLTPDKVLPYQVGVNRINLFSIVVDPECRDRVRAFVELSNTFKRQLRELAILDKKVLQASAVALSEVGVKLCITMNMTEIGANNKGVVFYSPDFWRIYLNESVKDVIRHRIKARKESENKS